MNNNLQECILHTKELSVLYVEDNPDARFFTLEVLKRFFNNITVGEDGKDGLKKFQTNAFDMVITDINMPNMNGLEMAKEIKNINSSIPILVLSAHNEENFFISSIQIGIDGYLLKPLGLEQFINTLSKFIEKIKLQKELKDYQLRLEASNAELEARVKERTSELEYRLYHDNLTNLENHQAMMKNISIDADESMFLIDINDFQKFNDIYGLNSGNNILKKFAQKLIEFDQHNRFDIYRIYSDVFVLHIKEIGISDKDFFLHKDKLLSYLETINIYLKDIDEFIDINVTVGACLNEKNGFIKTDIALQFAKKENMHIALYSEDIDNSKKHLNDLYWKSEIKSALANDFIIPVFQGIVDKEQNIVKYECLMRLKQYNNNDEKLISPFFFLDAAVNTQQYNKLTRVMVQKSFAFMQDKNIDFSINLSFQDLSDPSRVEFLHDEIEKFGVQTRLILEILESEIFSDYKLVIDTLQKFREKGVRIAIDDFGSGYSNFEHILKLRPDYIKIDGSLVKNILDNKDSFTLVKAIAEFSKELNIKVIAEFVSSEDIFNILKTLDIDEYQGFYFSVPSVKLI